MIGRGRGEGAHAYGYMPVGPDQGSSVTLILYSIDKDWWRGSEPFLNLIAAAAQFSSFTHVEMAIGEDSGAHGEMGNVLRIFNDATGVVNLRTQNPLPCPVPETLSNPTGRDAAVPQELCQRTGKNPNYQYVQVGCSQRQITAMLHWARRQVGKPFSSSGMARAILWPRESDEKSWYCADF